MVLCRSVCIRGPSAPNKCEGTPRASRIACSRLISISSGSVSLVTIETAANEGISPIPEVASTGLLLLEFGALVEVEEPPADPVMPWAELLLPP